MKGKKSTQVREWNIIMPGALQKFNLGNKSVLNIRISFWLLLTEIHSEYSQNLSSVFCRNWPGPPLASRQIFWVYCKKEKKKKKKTLKHYTCKALESVARGRSVAAGWTSASFPPVGADINWLQTEPPGAQSWMWRNSASQREQISAAQNHRAQLCEKHPVATNNTYFLGEFQDSGPKQQYNQRNGEGKDETETRSRKKKAEGSIRVRLSFRRNWPTPLGDQAFSLAERWASVRRVMNGNLHRGVLSLRVQRKWGAAGGWNLHGEP